MNQVTIVTGGAGFIGSHLVRQLIESGQSARVIELPGTDVEHLPAGVEVIFADIRDRDALGRAFLGGDGFIIWPPILTCGRVTVANSMR